MFVETLHQMTNVRFRPLQSKLPLSKRTFLPSLHFAPSKGPPHAAHQQPVKVFAIKARRENG